jgi:hypothetical protein
VPIERDAIDAADSSNSAQHKHPRRDEIKEFRELEDSSNPRVEREREKGREGFYGTSRRHNVRGVLQ